MKMVKIISLLMSILIFVVSCNKPDPIDDCSLIQMNIIFTNDSMRDVTNDSIELGFLYDIDSIKYQIISNNDTTNILSPQINRTGLYNVFSLEYYFGRKFGNYNVVFYLNNNESDTILLNIIDKYRINYTYKDKLIKSENGNCGILDYTIKK